MTEQRGYRADVCFKDKGNTTLTEWCRGPGLKVGPACLRAMWTMGNVQWRGNRMYFDSEWKSQDTVT